jgi:hypothetical protein
MILESVKFAFIVYAIAAVIAFLVAGLIKIIFAIINRNNNKAKKEEKPVLAKPAAQE